MLAFSTSSADYGDSQLRSPTHLFMSLLPRQSIIVDILRPIKPMGAPDGDNRLDTTGNDIDAKPSRQQSLSKSMNTDR